LQANVHPLFWGKLYIEKSGKSKWVVAFVQSVGFPVPLPLIFYSPTHTKLTKSDSFETKPKLSIVFSWYLVLGLMCAMMDLIYMPMDFHIFLFPLML